MKLSVNGKIWQVAEEDVNYQTAAKQKYGISSTLSHLLNVRGVNLADIENFLEPRIKNFLPDPYIFKDMEKAVEFIFDAVTKNKNIWIYGDYDVDGCSASAILKLYFKELGVDANVYIPNRFKEGYGINTEAVKSLHKKGAELIITVDCGVTAFEPLEKAKDLGVDVIVIDHHLSIETMPEAIAIVNPNRLDENIGFEHLCAAGMSFILIAGLNRKFEGEGYFEKLEVGSMKLNEVANTSNFKPQTLNYNKPNILKYLDLTALGTVCDVMLLKDINRAFVSQGIKLLSKRRNIGLSNLMDIAGVNETPNCYTLGFIIGPRINAAGRLEDASYGLKLLTSDDDIQAKELACKLNQLNLERQEIEKQALEEAIKLADKAPEEQSFMCIAGQGWHQGVIGIVAARIKERYNKPTAIIAIENGVGKASARSVSGIDIGSAITSAKAEGLLVNGGGHKAAAGFTIDESKIDEFIDYVSKRIENDYQNYVADNTRKVDISISPQAISMDLADEITKLSPFGNANKEPLLMIENAKIVNIKIYAGKHIAFFISDNTGFSNSKAIKCIAFNAVATPLEQEINQNLMKTISVIGKLKKNHFNGNVNLEIVVEDVVV